ncbi:hypothetical protein [Pimelobacter simplex]|uniref:hypothetical protein n=1 Tax=Nocardioides simplex TaxID=2045 RepID=UPI001931C0B5|nr:hypothetical protein [Pimelobacter simplex]
MSTPTFVRRAVAAVAGGAVVAGGLMAVAPAPAAHADSAAQSAAATWLAGELDVDGLLHGDVAKTIDFALALDEIGGHQATLDKIKAGVDAEVDTYAVGGVSIAQANLFYRAIDVDPATKAGNLVTKLEAAVDNTTGQLDEAFPGAWSQGLAVRALDAADSAELALATDSLIDDFECPTGGWGYYFNGSCTADPDDTADMLFALLPQKGTSAKIDDAIARGVAWLKAAQKADGGFENFVVNASSTGLAAHALLLAGATTEGQRAAAWLRRHQVSGTACDLLLQGEAGAVGGTEEIIKEGRDFGIDPAAAGFDWYLATAQSIVALQAAPASTAPLALSPRFVHVSSTASLQVTGLAAGENGCVSVAGAASRVQGGATTTAPFTVPAAVGEYQVTVTALGRSTTATVEALDATKLKVKVPAKVKANKKATVKVKGLAAGESVTVKIGKKAVTGTAKANGVAKVKIKVKKKGKAKVKVVGQFPDRKGKAITRVV